MQRVIFANQLRGLAALSVVTSHLVGIYWAVPEFVGLATASPAQTGTPPWLFRLILSPWISLGPFGVGVFFLISGFVIPLSLERHTRATFIAARLLRIYPTYAVAFALGCAAITASGAYWGRGLPYDTWTLMSNALLVPLYAGRPSVDLVNWTLMVELSFYALATAGAPWLRRASVPALFAAAAALIAMTQAIAVFAHPTGQSAPPFVASALSLQAPYLIFMLIGVAFSFHLRGRIGDAALLFAAGTLAALFLLCLRVSVLRDQPRTVSENYLYALILFAVLYMLRGRARPFAPLDALAAISFPLYLVHSLLGFCMLKLLMMGAGFGYGPALVWTIALILVVAFVLHRTIELKTIAWGHALARRTRLTHARTELRPTDEAVRQSAR